jgi:purine catabolism regulator
MCAQRAGILTVDELVNGSGLDVRVAGGAAAVHRRIEAIHISENEDVLQWISRGTLLLTTGARIKSNHQTGVRLMGELLRAGMAGLLLSMGPHLKKVPAGMAEEADRIRFPLLSSPSDMPLRAVTSYVNDALASHEMHRLRRSLSLQRELVGLLGQEEGTLKLTCRLAALLEEGIVLLRKSGSVEAASGLEPFSITGRAIQEALPDAIDVRCRGPLAPITIKGYPVTYRVIYVDNAPEAVLAVVHRDRTESVSEFEADTLAFAEQLLKAYLQSRQVTTACDHATQSRLLENLVRGRNLPRQVDDALAEFGISLAATTRLGIVDPGTGRNGVRQEKEILAHCESSLFAFAEQMHVACLASPIDGQVVFLTSIESSSLGFDERDYYAGLSSRIAGDFGDECSAIGLSEPLTALGSLRSSYSQALQALMRSSKRAISSGAFFFEDLGLTAGVLDSLPDERLAALKARIVDPLMAHDRHDRGHLYDTLATYLGCDRSLSVTTRMLNLHRNSLRYRLLQIERILELSFDDVDDSADIYLGWRAHEVLAARMDRDNEQ